MAQKTYQLPKVGGGETTKSLAPPTLRRVKEFLEILGVKDLGGLRTPEGQIDYGLAVMKAGTNKETLTKLFDVCLVEGCAEVDFDALDLRVTDEMIQDFFEQRSKTIEERTNSRLNFVPKV